MKATALSKVILAAIASTCLVGGEAFKQPAQANSEPTDNTELAQIYSGDQRMVSSYGRGNASAPADTAEIRIYFNSTDPYAPYPVDTGEVLEAPAPKPITESELQPIVDALVRTGVPASSIKMEVAGSSPNAYPGSGNIFLMLNQPTQSKIDEIVRVAQETATAKDLFFSSSDAQCKLADIKSLEDEARALALEDARRRVTSMASASGARLTQVLNIIEFPSFGYSPTYSPCNSYGAPFTPNPEVSIEIGVLMTFGMQ
jgi:Protein of unknown function (DUF541)